MLLNYAIVDIETNGKTKITEISIFITDGNEVLDEYTSLVNPEAYIPPFITSLTGINAQMVEHSPRFFEIAKKVHDITKDCIFVAHAVNFDYNIIKGEFKELGFEFSRKKLCTVRLSRKILPGLKSYSLGNLCNSIGISISNRHRARGDAEATVKLFKMLLKKDADDVIKAFLNPRSRQATLPPLLAKEKIDSLPEKEGVYYFFNEHKEIIYVGKANNIKQRVVSHFYDKAKKELAMCLEIADINYCETGNELIALLLESAEIKHYFPKYNRAQRRSKESIGIFAYEDRKGIIHLAFNALKLVKKPLIKFYNSTSCRQFLERLCEEFELCPKYCHLQSSVGHCFHYQIKECKGICRDEESIEEYNNRVLEAISSLKFEQESFIITEKGRKPSEKSFVLVLNSIYKGFGYIDSEHVPKALEHYLKQINHHKDNSDIKRILSSYLKRNDCVITYLDEEVSNAHNYSQEINLFNIDTT